jgi:hypothetical protein
MQLTITKLEAARRQLETAIKLYFDEGDSASIHTLCCAAYNVIQVLNKKQNSPLTLNDMMLKDLSDLMPTRAKRKDAHDYLNQTENFLKHGNSDPDATHTFDSNYTEALLFDAVIKYGRLAGECSPELAMYLIWFASLHPEIVDAADISDELRQRLKVSSKVLLKDGPKKFYQDVRPGAAPVKVPEC